MQWFTTVILLTKNQNLLFNDDNINNRRYSNELSIAWEEFSSKINRIRSWFYYTFFIELQTENIDVVHYQIRTNLHWNKLGDLHAIRGVRSAPPPPFTTSGHLCTSQLVSLESWIFWFCYLFINLLLIIR